MKTTGSDHNKTHSGISNGIIPGKYKSIESIFPLLIISAIFYLVFNTSCANIGSPSGGPKDSIAPVLLQTTPTLRSTNYKGKDVRFTFNEYILPDDIRDNLVISPPMKKKPVIKMKSKTLIVEFPEDLKDSTTYSLDFKDAVVDNNEKNPIEDFRFSFSTGAVFDSLRVTGYVKNSLTQEPVEKALIVLHRMAEYTALIDSIPDYIGISNKEGLFMIDNIAPGSYRLYSVTDADNSLTYNSNAELIAFADSLIVPTARFEAKIDTLIKGNDTIVTAGHTDFFPEPQYLMMFEEEKFEQYLNDSKRTQANRCDFFFSETLSDSFKISLLSPKYDKEWSYIESNLKRDSIMVWITDTIVSKSDTLKFELKYEVLDSMEQMVIKRDTLEMSYNAQKAPKPKRKKDEVIPLPTINLSNNINSTAHDIYRRINIEAPEPLISFDLDRIRLYSLEDTIKKQIPITVQKDSNSVRKFFVEHQWIENSYYVFQIDSAAARNIYGIPNNTVDQKFKIQKEGFYGKIFLTLTGLKEPAIVQLLSNDKDEKVLQKIQVLGDGKIEFPYLSPNKYKLRVISDPNKNGKWDTGYLANSIQPEKVFYYPKIIKIKSNFDIVETWKIDFRPDYKKELIDEEVEKEKARKKEQGIKSTTTNGK